MKKAGKIICFIIGAFLILFGLIFTFLEARNLFSGDYLLYENQADGFVRYLFRLIISLFSLSLGIFTYFALNKKENKTLHIYFYFASLALLISSIIIAIYATNYIDILTLTLSIIFFIGALLHFVDEIILIKKEKDVNSQ